jgi:CspA family cold shock protein
MTDDNVLKTGIVKNYMKPNGYGFITNDDGSGDIFIHLNQLKESGLDDLNKGEKVSFKIKKKSGKSFATDIKLL